MKVDLSAVEERYRGLFRLLAHVYSKFPDLCGSLRFWEAVEAALTAPHGTEEFQLSDDAAEVGAIKRAAERLQKVLDFEGLKRASMDVFQVVSALDDEERALLAAGRSDKGVLERGAPPVMGELFDEGGESGPSGSN